MFDLLLLIFRCLSMLYTVKCNSRNTEDFVRTLWTALLYDFCWFSAELIPSSEFRLYTSKRDNEGGAGRDANEGEVNDADEADGDAYEGDDDEGEFYDGDEGEGDSLEDEGDDDEDDYAIGNISLQTTAEPTAKDVIPDFIVLIPVEHKDSRTRLKEFLSTTPKTIAAPFLKIDLMFAPLLVELKRSPSRHHHRIDKFVANLHALMHAARVQALLQGNCLFSSGKFSEQNEVMLVAASGQWWSMRFYHRKESHVFQPGLYANFLRESSFDESDIEVDDEVYLPNKKGMAQEFAQDMAVKEAEVHKKFLKKTSVEPASERKRRLQARKTRKPALEALEAFVKKHENEGPFSEALINDYRHLSKAAGFGPRTPVYARLAGKIPIPPDFSGVAHSDPGTISKPQLLTQWTLPMKVGSAASDAHLEFIKKQLRKAADKRRF